MRHLVLVSLAACGLGPAPDPATSEGAAGTAPWLDRGAVRVCLDDTAIGPAPTDPAGLCVPHDALPAACTRDADCRSRESCVCGACTVAYCDSAADCEAPRSCTFAQHRCDTACADSTTCGDAENCINNVCRGRCATSADCQHGEFCDFQHVCSSDDCATVADCQGTERCELQRVPHALREPSPIAQELYVELDGAIWRARCADPTHCAMAPDVPVLDGRAPSVVRDGDLTYVYIELDDGIAVATAADGASFGSPALVLGGTGLHTPSVVHVGGTALLYYEQGDAIGLATGPVGAPLVDQGIVLRPADVAVGDGTPGTAFWLGITRLASPHALVAGPDGAIHLWFSGFGTESADATKFGQPLPIPANFSVGFAAAPADDPARLSPWPYGPVVDRVTAFLEHRDELGPGIVDAGDDRYFLYELDASHDAAGVFTLGHLEVYGSDR